MPPGPIVEFNSSNDSLDLLKMANNESEQANITIPKKSMKELSLDDEGSVQSLDVGLDLAGQAPSSSSGEKNHESFYQDSWGEGLGIGALPGEELDDDDYNNNYADDSSSDNMKYGGSGQFRRRNTEPTTSSSTKKKKKIGSLFGRKKNKNRDRSLDSSSHSSFSIASSRSSSSAYAGPKPVGPDGKPLKSCLSSSNLRHLHYPSDEEGGGSSSLGSTTTGDAPPAPPKPMKRNVSFQSIEIREYERAVGDHPCVSSGPPITIGWAHTDGVEVPLDQYEESKPENRTKAEMMIPRRVRENILKTEAKATTGELMKATKAVNITKNNRKKTAATTDVHHIHEATEFLNRRLKRVTSGKDKDREQEELWEKAHQEALKKYMKGELDPSMVVDNTTTPPLSISFGTADDKEGSAKNDLDYKNELEWED
mmetsp:Transcript_28031/g.39402  ORF Transcript_28031/g.39402 Transcript_28031/m.39402 type:complete len:425 (-) Transcript_28031:372-1646(-)